MTEIGKLRQQRDALVQEEVQNDILNNQEDDRPLNNKQGLLNKQTKDGIQTTYVQGMAQMVSEDPRATASLSAAQSQKGGQRNQQPMDQTFAAGGSFVPTQERPLRPAQPSDANPFQPANQPPATSYDDIPIKAMKT